MTHRAIAIAAALAAFALPALAAGNFSWKSGPQENGAYLSYEDDGEGEDRQALVSIYCFKGEAEADLVFWTVAEEADDGKPVKVVVTIGEVSRFFSGNGSSKMNGIGVDTKIALSDPMLEKIASGTSMSFGIEGREFTTIPLKRTRKGVALLRETCL